MQPTKRCADLTSHMTQWPDYRNANKNEKSNKFWNVSDSLNGEALNRFSKVQDTVQRTSNALEKHDLFTKSKWNVDFSKMKSELENLAANEIYLDPANCTKEFEKGISKIVKIIVQKFERRDPAKPESLLAGDIRDQITDRIRAIALNLTVFNDVIQKKLKEHIEGPQSLVKDRRVEDVHVSQLNKIYQMDPSAYKALIKAWEEQGHILKGVPMESCFKWAGELTAYARINAKVIWLGNALHTAASVVDAIDVHAKDADFYVPMPKAKEEDEADVFSHLKQLRDNLEALEALKRGLGGVRMSFSTGSEKPSECNQQ